MALVWWDDGAGNSGLLSPSAGALTDDLNCCCFEGDCIDICNAIRAAAGLDPLPDNLTLEVEDVTATCLGATCSVNLSRTTREEWLSDDNSCLGDWTFACQDPLWNVAVLAGNPQPDSHKFTVSVNCTATSGQALVEWYEFPDANGYLGCGSPPDYLETLRFRILIP